MRGGEGVAHAVGVVMRGDVERRPGVALDALGGGAFRQDDQWRGVESAGKDRLDFFQGDQEAARGFWRPAKVQDDEVRLLDVQGAQGTAALEHDGGAGAPVFELENGSLDGGGVVGDDDDALVGPGIHLPILRRFSRQRRTHSRGG